ncbi:MAG: leucine-rich repeat domain-containing protein [Gammaproteobacteria bacterium]|nr:leucine-rich repeat domain-containing protein [Gammaproteobacteria bacterium]
MTHASPTARSIPCTVSTSIITKSLFRIETLSADTLLHSLHSIYLNNNRIKSVAAGSFRKLLQLRRVELQDNQLAHLEMSAVELSYSGKLISFHLFSHAYNTVDTNNLGPDRLSGPKALDPNYCRQPIF